MPGSAVVHAAVFTAGALLGGGIAAVVSCRKDQQQPVFLSRSAPHQPATVMEHQSSAVLKYGHPGEFGIFLFCRKKHSVMARGIYIGPISDLIHRQAYVAAYDRRLRHPAWVCVLFFSSLFLFFTILYQTAEHLSLTSLGKSRVTPREEEGPAGDRANSTFKEDESLPLMFRSKLSDYFKSGYDRGHM